MHNKEPNTYVEYKRCLNRFLDYWTASKTKGSLPETLTQWIQNEWDAGHSPSPVTKALSFLDTVQVALNPIHFSSIFKHSTIAYYLKTWEEAWKRRGKTIRRTITWEQAKLISQHPPKGVDSFKWQCYVLFAWAFMLRHGEIRRVSPLSVQFIEQSNKWEIDLGKCKTTRERGLTQVARFPCHLLPAEVIQLLKTFVKLPDTSFSWGINKSKVSSHLRCVLQTDNLGYVFHSLRHGRATHLRKYDSVNDPDLKVLGRWLSNDALYCYLHC